MATRTVVDQQSLWELVAPALKHVVEVNECAIFATRMGDDWWNWFRWNQLGRIVIVTPSIAGDRVHVRCDSREHCDWLMATMTSAGIPKSAVRYRKLKPPANPEGA